MRKIMSTLVAVSMSLPASLALASDAAAEGAAEAGEQAVEAGRMAREAGAEAAEAGTMAREAGEQAQAAGEKAERKGVQALRAVDATHGAVGRAEAPAVAQARLAVGELQRADPHLARFFDGAAGYAVFPTVGKGAVGLGGAHGEGVLFEQGQPVGRVTLTQLTVGLQLGGQAYTEVIFLETGKTLAAFKDGKFTMAAQASAVAATTGASANAGYVEGVRVFTLAKGGLMAEASVGGQKFGYHPYHRGVTTSAR